MIKNHSCLNRAILQCYRYAFSVLLSIVVFLVLDSAGRFGRVFEALPPPLQRESKCAVLPGSHVVLRASVVEATVEGIEQRRQNGNGEGT